MADDVLDFMGNDNVDMVEEDDGSLTFSLDDNTDKAIIDYIAGAPFDANLAIMIEDDTLLNGVGDDVVRAYDADKESRAKWEDKIEKGMFALGLVDKAEEARYQNATKIVHPGLCTAVMHSWARYMKEFWPLNGPIKSDIVGDADQDLIEKAKRQEVYLNALLLYKIPDAYEEDSRAAYELYTIGSAFKKVYLDERGRIRDSFVSAVNLIVPYFGATSLETAPRVTEEIEMPRSEIERAMVTGAFRHVELAASTTIINEFEGDIAKTRTLSDDAAETYLLLEQHIDVDFGEAGFAVPYIITVLKDGGDVLRIVRNWREGDPDYTKEEYYTHMRLPGMGFYGFGLYQLAPGLVESQVSILRSLIEAGHYANIQGGFVTRELGKIIQEKGSMTIGPGQWHIVPSTDDLRRGVFPMTYKEPSPTLFNLLPYLDEKQDRLFSTTNVPMGEITNQMPVGTATIAVEQANVVPNSILLGVHFAKRKEYNLLKRRVFMQLSGESGTLLIKGKRITANADDFNDDVDVCPTNDPQTNGAAQQMAKAQGVMQLASNPNSSLDYAKCEQYVLKAMRVADYEALLKQQQPPMMPPQPSPMEQANLDAMANEEKRRDLNTQIDLQSKVQQAEQAQQSHQMDMRGKAMDMQGKQLDQIMKAMGA